MKIGIDVYFPFRVGKEKCVGNKIIFDTSLSQVFFSGGRMTLRWGRGLNFPEVLLTLIERKPLRPAQTPTHSWFGVAICLIEQPGGFIL